MVMLLRGRRDVGDDVIVTGTDGRRRRAPGGVGMSPCRVRRFSKGSPVGGGGSQSRGVGRDQVAGVAVLRGVSAVRPAFAGVRQGDGCAGGPQSSAHRVLRRVAGAGAAGGEVVVSALDDGWGRSLMEASVLAAGTRRGGTPEQVRAYAREELAERIAEVVKRPGHFWSGGRMGVERSGHPISRADRKRQEAFVEHLFVTRAPCQDCGCNRWVEDSYGVLVGREPDLRHATRYVCHCRDCGSTVIIREVPT